MATSEPDKEVKLWMGRVRSAQKAQEEWEKLYDVPLCRQYWTGVQREKDKLQINLILPTIRQRIPSLYFYHPFARVQASPAKNDTPGETVDEKAQLLQDTANALVRDPRTGLKEQTLLSLKEAHWAFGCIEVGYSAEFADNPSNKQQAPPLKEDKDTEGVENQYPKVISEEWFWTRRIPPRQILVSCPESTIVEENDWVGYWEFQHVEDVKKAAAYSNTTNLKGSGGEEKKDEASDSSLNDVKLYKIWDLRKRVRYVFAEGHDKKLLKQEFERLPLFFLRFELEPDKFRPIPLIHGLLGSQDEYDESRQFISMQRKTRVPRYTVDVEGVEPGEMEKFEDNQPNVWIKRRQNTSGDVISPVMQPNMSDSSMQSLTLSRQEFDQQSGIGAEARQQATSGTATQAAIMNQRQTINDSFDRYIVAEWLGKIIRELVMLAIDKMTLPQWIMLNSDQYSPMFMQDAQGIAEKWQQITQQSLEQANESVRWDVSVDVESLSPVSEQEKQAQWNQILAMISSPAVAPLLAMSPELLKRTMDLNGIKSGKDQAAIQNALAMKAQMEMQMAQMQAQGPPGVPSMAGAPAPPGGPGQAVPRPPQMIPGPGEGMVQ